MKFENTKLRDGSGTAASSEIERFVIIANGWKPLTIIAKRSILDVASVLDPPQKLLGNTKYNQVKLVLADFALAFLYQVGIKLYLTSLIQLVSKITLVTFDFNKNLTIK